MPLSIHLVIEYIDEKEYEGQSSLDEDDDIRENDNEKIRVSLTVQEELFKKMIQRDWIETGLDDEEYRIHEDNHPVSTKTKKKKKKNKKNKAEASKVTGEGTNQVDPTLNNNNKEGIVLQEKENISSMEVKKKDYLSIFWYFLLK